MKLSVIGIGNIGRALTCALVSAGHEVTVFNRTPAKADALREAGVRVSPTAAEAIDVSDATLLTLLDGASTRQVLESAEVCSAVRGKPLINAAAMDPDDSISLSALVAAHGGRYSDMAVVAYPQRVEQRTAEYVLSCHPDDAVLWAGIFRAISVAVYDVGAIGNAQKVVNALGLTYAYQTIAIGSAVAAFERLGLPLEVAQSMLSSSPTLAIANAHYVIPEMASRRYGSDQWSVDNMIAVCDELIGFSEKIGIDPCAIEGVREMYAKASRLGFGSQDITALYEALNPRN